MSWDVANPELDKNSPSHTLDTMPKTWAGITREAKVQMILDVATDQMRLVRNGTFSSADATKVAALSLEGQMCLIEFFTDAEAAAKNAKHMAEYIESETCDAIAAKAVNAGDKKPAEAALKRAALLVDKVKEARKKAVDLDKEYKKWRYVLDVLKESHVFFRRLSND